MGSSAVRLQQKWGGMKHMFRASSTVHAQHTWRPTLPPSSSTVACAKALTRGLELEGSGQARDAAVGAQPPSPAMSRVLGG